VRGVFSWKSKAGVRGDSMRYCLALGLGLVALGGCGSEQKQPSAPPQATASAPLLDATGVANAFKKAGLPVTSIKALDEASDDNHLLGRPAQYTSKVFFYDGRHPQQAGSEEGENTIEVFADAADAKTRDDYIAGVTKGVAFAQQYRYLHGRTLVRLDKVLLPLEAKRYDAVLQSMAL